MKHQVDVHAWVLMTNHVHLLCTPWKENAISRMMQSIGRLYVRYYNHAYQRSGTLWEGRFKSCLVQSERYLLELHGFPFKPGHLLISTGYEPYAHGAFGGVEVHPFHQVAKRTSPEIQFQKTAWQPLCHPRV